MAGRVWLNIDLGELPDEADELYALAHVANVACGGHAGDEASMRRAIALCRAGAALGAHPSYPDRAGFGRTKMAMEPADLRRAVTEQCARLAAIALESGAPVRFAKAHGALYHAAADDDALAGALVAGIRDALGGEVTVIGPARGAVLPAAAAGGLAFAREAFADRGTRPDGTLVPRGAPGALLSDPQAAAAQARSLAARGDVETIGVHGDTPGAVAVARAVRAALEA